MADSNFTSINSLISLNGKRAIVTGGAQGIGYAIAFRLAEAGATVVIADCNVIAGKKAVQQIVESGYAAQFISCDVSVESDIKSMTNLAVDKTGGIDILVNNAGIFPAIPFDQITKEDFEKTIAVNLTGMLQCSQFAARHMIEQKRGGTIINIASIDSMHPSFKGSVGYTTSKGGVLMLTKSMALELGQHSIRVNAIAPGAILTEGTLARGAGIASAQAKAQLKEWMAHAVLGRMGEADDIGRVALFLASDLSSYMTGSVIVVDGGYLLS
jgi:2-dehydro-3-deoxy-D-gluconate 5-dehydrogenase